MSDLATFVLSHLPPPPARVLEVGCGKEGGIVEELRHAGYDALGVDPHAPGGPHFRQVELDELDDAGPFAAAVAGRVLHHVEPLGPALERLAELAPLLLVDEFAWNRFDEPTEQWYDAQYRVLSASGHDLHAPPTIAEWRERHPGLHREETLRAALDARYDELAFERRPYLYRWLGGPATRALEESLIAAGAIQPLGWVYAGVTRARR